MHKFMKLLTFPQIYELIQSFLGQIPYYLKKLNTSLEQLKK